MNLLLPRVRISRVRIIQALTNPAVINGVLKAYRPLYQRGLLMDGLYRWPCANDPDSPSQAAPRKRERMSLVAGVWFHPARFFNRDKP
jgi:hypothetical protein